MAESVLAPAKINLVLEVLGRRSDGYHEIDTVLQTLALADHVSVEDVAAADAGVLVTGPRSDGVPVDPSNLAWKAATLLAERIRRDPSRLRVSIEKHIPPAGGLGGGSSDAAAVLRLLARRWPEVTADDLLDVATRVGSDEAFFLAGGTARAQGRGERVTQLVPLAPHGVVLFIPPGTLERKTARLFEHLGRLPFDHSHRSARFVAGQRGQLTTSDLYNSFERVAFDVFPGLGDLRRSIEARIGAEVRLSGAGPAMFWIGPVTATERTASLAGGLDCDVVATRTAD